MQNGKGSRNRSNNKKYSSGYDEINWGGKISKKTLDQIDKSIKNLQKGIVGSPIQIDASRDLF